MSARVVAKLVLKINLMSEAPNSANESGRFVDLKKIKVTCLQNSYRKKFLQFGKPFSAQGNGYANL